MMIFFFFFFGCIFILARWLFFIKACFTSFFRIPLVCILISHNHERPPHLKITNLILFLEWWLCFYSSFWVNENTIRYINVEYEKLKHYGKLLCFIVIEACLEFFTRLQENYTLHVFRESSNVQSIHGWSWISV